MFLDVHTSLFNGEVMFTIRKGKAMPKISMSRLAWPVPVSTTARGPLFAVRFSGAGRALLRCRAYTALKAGPGADAVCSPECQFVRLMSQDM